MDTKSIHAASSFLLSYFFFLFFPLIQIYLAFLKYSRHSFFSPTYSNLFFYSLKLSPRDSKTTKSKQNNTNNKKKEYILVQPKPYCLSHKKKFQNLNSFYKPKILIFIKIEKERLKSN